MQQLTKREKEVITGVLEAIIDDVEENEAAVASEMLGEVSVKELETIITKILGKYNG